jgi:hypothetical protein
VPADAVAIKDPTAAGCLEEEINAFSSQAGLWSRLPASFRSTSTAGRHNDRVAAAWAGGYLRYCALTSEGYHVQCLGRVLPNV